MPRLPMAPPSGSSADSLFAAWLAERESGAGSDLEALLAAHPARATELRELHDSWRRIESAREALRRESSPGPGKQEESAPFASHVTLEDEGAAAGSFTAEVLGRLADRRPASGRYRQAGEIARGGMGEVLRVWDEDLRRQMAMKVMLGQRATTDPDGTPESDPRQLARFLEEAQVTGQLDHPGIVPVHELGIDASGRVYFTMKLVKGRDLKEVLDLLREGREGWTMVKALGVLLRVCEAMAYAHDKGVIHRDLKPSNIMVGRFGEVYVMDWGLARILGREDRRDIRLRTDEGASQSTLRTDRREHAGDTPGSPLMTMDGDVVGTPAYMPPEQAAGNVAEMGPPADVYAVGAMLYHLLANQAPYTPESAGGRHHLILWHVLDGPPRPLREIAPRVPEELAAICEKAMARDPAARYADMSELAEDLSAYLEGRVVHAYETGVWPETRKWVQRNKLLAGALVLAALGLGGVGYFEARGRRLAETERARRQVEEARALRLEDVRRAGDLSAEAWRLPARTLADVRRLEALLDEARDLAPRLSLHARLATNVNGPPTGGLDGVRAAGTTLSMDAGVLYELEGLREELEHDDPNVGTIARLERRLDAARRSVLEPDARSRWAEVLADVRADGRFAGLELSPQVGLLPIGKDPDSELWEFVVLETGAPPKRRAWTSRPYGVLRTVSPPPPVSASASAPADGPPQPGPSPVEEGPAYSFEHGDRRLEIRAEMGLVLVLVPPSEGWVGAQDRDPGRPNYDPAALPDEAPVRRVELPAYFVSKYEMTQGQWQHARGARPSGNADVPLFPVEGVSWEECAETLAELGLELPTEAQWEIAARAGTTSTWWGAHRELVFQGAAHVDASGPQPVGATAANGFGLHDTIGNVSEWCADAYAAFGDDDLSDDSGGRAIRGASYDDGPEYARSAFRDSLGAGSRRNNQGLRPVRAVLPDDS